MAVLSDKSIVTLLQEEALGIEPFTADHLTPNGYDLTIGEVVLPESDSEPVTFTEGKAAIPGRERFLISTEEVVTLGEKLTAQLWIRSSYARKGIMAAFGKVEAGFSGTLTVGCVNTSKYSLELPVGDRFCQIAFEALTTSAEELYEQRSGNYQHQRGVTFAKE